VELTGKAHITLGPPPKEAPGRPFRTRFFRSWYFPNVTRLHACQSEVAERPL